tara:strand:+ start:2419 stop:2712 length:294 start_codon:yes stop_codon:yes gene_type:complete
MNIGVFYMSYRLSSSHSLKAKRQAVTSLISRVHRKFNVSVTEYGDLDIWQRITLMACVASADPNFPDQLLESITFFINEMRPDLELIDCSTELISGV